MNAVNDDFRDLNIVEIGRCYVKHVLPQTKCYMSANPGGENASTFEPLSTLRAALDDPLLDLVICYPQGYHPWDWRFWLRKLGNRDIFRGYFPMKSILAPQYLRRKIKAPIAIVDLEDNRFIWRQSRFLLDRATVYFKRELPVDHWQVFMLTDHYSIPTARYRSNQKNQRRVEKLLPLSLGPVVGSEHEFPPVPVAKTSDIFFAGVTESASSVRQRGMKELLALRDLGIRVDIPDGRLSRAEFFQRAAAAHLVWSPEGFGWDCFRHYEAPLCWSVPLINHPTIDRYMPLDEGVHALYYHPEPGGLTKTIHAALSDMARIERIAKAAHAHVSAHHTHAAHVRYIIDTTLARARLQRLGSSDAK